jgi:hypothetical protein
VPLAIQPALTAIRHRGPRRPPSGQLTRAKEFPQPELERLPAGERLIGDADERGTFAAGRRDAGSGTACRVPPLAGRAPSSRPTSPAALGLTPLTGRAGFPCRSAVTEFTYPTALRIPRGVIGSSSGSFLSWSSGSVGDCEDSATPPATLDAPVPQCADPKPAPRVRVYSGKSALSRAGATGR